MVASSFSACFRVYGVLAACVFLLLGNVLAQTPIYLVNPDATGTGTPRTDVVAASDWNDFAYSDLQTAIAAAASTNGQIWVKAGVYHPSVDPTGNATPADPRTRTFFLTTGQKLYGGFAGNETSLAQRNIAVNVTTLSGDFNEDDIVSGIDTAFSIANNAENACHIIVKKDTDGSVAIDGFVITGGNASPSNGGAAIDASSYTGKGYISINNNTFLGNNYKTIYINIVGNTIDNNIFKRNIGTVLSNTTANQWPGSAIVRGSIVSKNIFENNRSIHGTLIKVVDGNQGYENNIFINNKYEILMSISTVSLSVDIDNNLFINNNCQNAIILNTNSFCICNNIFYNNNNDDYSFHLDLATNPSWVAARNNIFQSDSISMKLATNMAHFPITSMDNLYMVDPLLVDINDPDGPDNIWRTADDGLALQATSPAIDAGYDEHDPLTDMLGLGRTDIPGIGNSICDIGAYELNGTPVAPTSTEGQAVGPDYRAWPNPATSLLHVNLPVPATTVALVDATGRTVLQAQTQGQSSCDLQIEHLPTGIYFLLIDGYSCNLKIAKN